MVPAALTCLGADLVVAEPLGQTVLAETVAMNL